MIKQYKPKDLEACLMALPIENWRIVDSEDHNYKTEKYGRPLLFIHQLDKLKGIVMDEKIKIKAFTTFDAIEFSPLPRAIQTIFGRSRAVAPMKHESIGCHFIENMYDDYMMTFLVANDAKVVLKSYMNERILPIKSHVLFEQNGFIGNNEMLYEFIFNSCNYDDFEYDIIRIGELRFSYFIAIAFKENKVSQLDFAIMLPNRNVMRLDEISQVMVGHDLEDSQIRHELKGIFTKSVKKKRIQVNNHKSLDELFDILIWKNLLKMTERSQYV